MNDITFDIVNREIVLKNNDFEQTVNPSVQNGGILLYSRCANPVLPILGIGILEVINAGMSKVAYELNRWQSQAKDDGATIAGWKSNPVNGSADIITDISYE